MLIFCWEGENIRNILALNRRFRGNKTRNIFAFRDIETFPILPPFSNGVITSGRIRKRNELYDMRTSRSPRSPLSEDFQRSGRRRVGVGSSNAKDVEDVIVRYFIRVWSVERSNGERLMSFFASWSGIIVFLPSSRIELGTRGIEYEAKFIGYRDGKDGLYKIL